MRSRNNIRAYFAHPVSTYGTEQEKTALKILRKEYPLLLCPNTDMQNFGGDMKYYLKIVEWCDAVLVMTDKGFIGRGVYQEIQKARKLKKPVFVIYKLRPLELAPIQKIKITDRGNWMKYAKIYLHKR